MAEYIKAVCPHCGKEMQIPSDLEEFSCLYCGDRVRKEVMLELQNTREGRYEEERAYLKERLPQTVTHYLPYSKKITKKEFFGAFETYESENRKILEHLDICARLDPLGVEHCMEEVCKELLDGVEAELSGDKKWSSKSKRDELLFDTRVVMAIFLTPLVKKRRLETAEPFRKELNRQWLERYPKHKWIPGDYDVLAEGFKKKKLCFITTATCRFDGKPDDCEELTAFRAFRDGWLTAHGGEAEIARYYEIAPSIVTCIDHCDDPAEIYSLIREKWLNPCAEAIREGRNEDCRRIYTEMVTTLQEKYYLS